MYNFPFVILKYDNLFLKTFDFSRVKKADLQIKIGKRIIELRTKKGWSQADLARACEKDRQAIEKIENGKVNTTIYSLMEIAEALEVSLVKIVDVG
jgi:putative transcriptional regulator